MTGMWIRDGGCGVGSGLHGDGTNTHGSARASGVSERLRAPRRQDLSCSERGRPGLYSQIARAFEGA